MAFLQYLSALEHNIDEWDMSGIIKQFPDRVTTDNKATDYYSIVTEIAKLKRNELREFKQRFQLSMQKCRANEFVRPVPHCFPKDKMWLCVYSCSGRSCAGQIARPAESYIRV
jgi:hypothetical protein